MIHSLTLPPTPPPLPPPSPQSWPSEFPLGSIVKSHVLEVRSYGVVLDLEGHDNILGLVLPA